MVEELRQLRRRKGLTSGNNNITFRKATKADIDTIKQLADAHRHELGFVRRPALLEAIKRLELIVADNCQELVGFIEYRHRKDEQTTLYNIVVKPNWRRKGIGKQLFQELANEAQTKSKQFILLKCPEDLPANDFYNHIGCTQINIENGKSRRLIVWKREV